MQPIADGFELCARLGLVLVPPKNLSQIIRFGIAHQFARTAPLHGFEAGKLVFAVLDNSPGAQAGIVARDIVLAINKEPWESVRLLTFSDRRPSEILLKTFVAWQFATAEISVRVPPEPYRPLEQITKETLEIIASGSSLDASPYQNPRDDPDPRTVRLWEVIGRQWQRGTRRR